MFNIYYFSVLTYIYYDSNWNKNVCQINENESFEDADRDTSQKRDVLHTFPLVTEWYPIKLQCNQSVQSQKS
jgi:hypothetical protein